jgi:hypothetical protein
MCLQNLFFKFLFEKGLQPPLECPPGAYSDWYSIFHKGIQRHLLTTESNTMSVSDCMVEKTCPFKCTLLHSKTNLYLQGRKMRQLVSPKRRCHLPTVRRHIPRARNSGSHLKILWNFHFVVPKIRHMRKLRRFLIFEVGDSKLYFTQSSSVKALCFVFVLVRNSIILTLKRINTLQKFRHREFFDYWKYRLHWPSFLTKRGTLITHNLC